MNPLLEHLDRLEDEVEGREKRGFLFSVPSDEEMETGDPFTWYFPIEEISPDLAVNFDSEEEDAEYDVEPSASMKVVNYISYYELCLRIISGGPPLSSETFALVYREVKRLLGKISAPHIFVYDLCVTFADLTRDVRDKTGQVQMGVFLALLLKFFPALLVESDEVRRLGKDFMSERSIKTFLSEVESLYFAELVRHKLLRADNEERKDCKLFISGVLTSYLEEEGQTGKGEIPAITNFEDFASDKKETRLFVTLKASLFIRGRRITPPDQDIFFDQIRCNRTVPYASASYDDERKRIMVFTGTDSRKPIPYRKMVKTKKRDERPHVIELFVGIPIDATDRNPFYYPALVDFETGFVQIRVQSVIYDRYASDLTTAFAQLGPEISASAFEIVSTSSQITMTMPDDFKFDDHIFHHLVMTNPLFRNTLYFNERATPASKRKGIKFYCVPFGGQNIRNAKGEPYTMPVAVSLSVFAQPNANGPDSIRVRLFLSKVTQRIDFVSTEIIDCLLYYYVGVNYGNLDLEQTPNSLKRISQVNALYRNANLLSEEVEVKKGLSTQSARKNKLQLQLLQDDYPHVFGPDYTRSCKGKAVPSVFLDEETARDASRQGRGEFREPTPFPDAQNPEFWVVSLHHKFPHIILVPNEDEKTQIDYPLVPCATDKIPRTLRNAAAKTREYVQTVDKFLEPGAFRQGNEALVNLFGIDFLNSYGVNYHETNQKNSLFHCFLFACDFNYRTLFIGQGLEKDILRSNRLRETYLTGLRAKHQFQGALCKQELYDQTEEEILATFRAADTFLDSSLFYRIFEEFFPQEKINIFVFTNEKDETGSRKLRLEIPRSSAYHCREVHLDRKSLILIRNYGPTSLLRVGSTTYPQYEIICQRIDKEPTTLLFGRKVTEICYNVLRETQKSVVWQREQGKLRRIEGISFAHRWQKKLGASVVSQFIDAAGYARIINFQHEQGKVSVFVPPCQPLNCPAAKTIVRVTEDVARSIFGQPSGCSFTTSGDVQGLWFPYLGLQAGIFCPVKAFASDQYAEIASDPLQELTFKNSIVNEVIALQNQAVIIKQLVTWLYNLAGKPATEDFIASYFEMGAEEQAKYDFSSLPSSLGDITHPEQAVAHIAQYAPSFIADGKIYLATPTLYERVAYFLRAYQKDYNARNVTRMDSLQVIERSVLSNRGFVKFFKSRLDFENWIDDFEENQGKTLRIQKKFTEATFQKKLLFVVKIPDGYFLVKNLPENSRLSDAERYGANWIETGVFDGYRTPTKKYPTMQYAVTAEQQAEHYSNSGDYPKGDPRHRPLVDGEPFVRVLVYGNVREISDEREVRAYAVLLPLA